MTSNKQDLDVKFDKLLKVFSSEDFIEKRKLAGEVPFFISHFDPSQQNAVDQYTKSLIKKLDSQGISVLEVNLFDVILKILEDKGKKDKILKKEPSLPKDKLRQQFERVLDYKTALIPEIMSRYKNQDHKMMFITGVGLVYPYIRTHSLLEHLQPTATQQPTVLFFPGEYKYSPTQGSILVLFGKKSKGYYRAFDLNNYDVKA
jgi:hypothetical protein